MLISLLSTLSIEFSWSPGAGRKKVEALRGGQVQGGRKWRLFVESRCREEESILYKVQGGRLTPRHTN
jgi:hypothetical protein